MILVTGVSGFLGGNLAKVLIEKGYRVFGVSRRMPKTTNLSFRSVDLSSKEQVEDLFRTVNIEGVIHCAAKSSAWGPYQEFYDANVIATRNLIMACEKKNIDRFVHVSSPSIYAQLENQFFVKETAGLEPRQPLNYYIETKRLAEEIVINSTLSYNIIRPRAIIGVGDTSVVPRLMNVSKKIGIPLFNEGKNLMDVTCVENVIHALILAYEATHDKGIYNITNGVPIQFKTLIEQLYKQLNQKPKFRKVPYNVLAYLAKIFEKIYPDTKEPPLTLYTLSTIAFSQTLSIEKASNELGYQPIITLEEKIGEYSDWYRRYL